MATGSAASLDIWPIINGLGLLGVGLFGVFIAYRQMVTARTKLQLDLYDKRLPVFDAVRVFLAEIATKGTMTDDAFIAYSKGIGNARFLFDEEIGTYLTELRKAGIEIQMYHDQMQGQPVGPARANFVQLKANRLIWLVGQMDTLEERFSPYLQLTQRNSRVFVTLAVEVVSAMAKNILPI